MRAASMKDFRSKMRVASQTRQRDCARKLEPLPGLVSSGRLRPLQQKLPQWIMWLKSSQKGPFFLVKVPTKNVFLVAAGVGVECWGFVMTSVSRTRPCYMFDVSTCFNDCDRLDVVLIKAGLEEIYFHAEVPTLYALSCEVDRIDGTRIFVHVTEATEVTRPERRPKMAGDHVSESGSADSQDFDMPSDEEFFVAEEHALDSEDEAEVAQEDVPVNQGEDLDDPIRAKPGTHILWNNGYFSLAHYKDGGDCKMILSSKFQQTGLPSSKTLQVSLCDTSKDGTPKFTCLCLRAWMLWRSAQGEWHQQHGARVAWRKAEMTQLREDLQDVDLPQPAAKLAQKWLPDIL